MEFVTEREGVRYYNDSKATTPVAAIAALNSFPERVILLAGGYDKKIPLDTFAQAIVERTRFVVLMGDVAKHLRETIERLSTRPGSPQVLMANGFTEAVGLARKDARSGDVVLLSPGCASYGMFNNYEERGERFKSLVRGAG
jgi:UDP-N-acetylmuramoylalanine--D-glutamate ligase